MGQTWEAELFSAYVDNELTPEERTAVEQRLAVDAAARAMVAEYRELSALLRSLPRESAPDGLHAAAMQAADALPQPPVLVTVTAFGPNPAVEQRPRTSRREWITALTAVATTVLCAVLINLQLPRNVEMGHGVAESLSFGTSVPEAWMFKESAAGSSSDHIAQSEDVMLRQVVNSGLADSDGVREQSDLARRGATTRRMEAAGGAAMDSLETTANKIAGGRTPDGQRDGSSASLVAGDKRANLRAQSGKQPSVPQDSASPKLAERSLVRPPAAASGAVRPRGSVAGASQTVPMAELPGNPAGKDQSARDLEAESRWVDAGANAPQDQLSFEEVLPYLVMNTSQGLAVANVDLMVMDVQRGANELQVLLVKNGVPAVNTSLTPVTDDDQPLDRKTDAGRSGESVEKSAPVSSSKPNAAAPGRAMVAAEPVDRGTLNGAMGGMPAEKRDAGELIAVYVEAPSESLTKTLEELSRRREILALRLQPPLQVTQVPGLNVSVSPRDSANTPMNAAGQALTARQLNGAYAQQYQFRFFAGEDYAERETVSAVDDVSQAAVPASVANGQLSALKAMNRALPSEELARSKADSAAEGVRELNRNDTSGRISQSAESSTFNTLVRLQVPELPLSELTAANRAQLIPGAPAAGAMPSAAPTLGDRNAVATAPAESQTLSRGAVRVLFVLKPAETRRLNLSPR